jgi:MFS family permease
MPLPGAWRELASHRNYRFYFASSTLGAFASTVQFLGHGWLLLSIAPGAVAVVAYMGTQFAVKVLLVVPAGILADRWPRASIYAWMRVASGFASLVGALALLSPAPIAVALIAAALAGAAHAFDLPAHRSLMCDVQPREQLERGLSLGSSGFHVAALLAPVLAFPLSAYRGPELALLLSAAVFFIAAIPAFAISDVVEHPPQPLVPHAAGDAREAFRFLLASPAVLLPMLLSALPPVMGKIIQIALPSLSGHEGDGSFGLVLAATELGAICAGLMMAGVDWRFGPSLPPLTALGYTVSIAAVCALTPLGGLAMASALFLVGCSMTALVSTSVAGIPHYAPRQLRGRLMTI